MIEKESANKIQKIGELLYLTGIALYIIYFMYYVNYFWIVKSDPVKLFHPKVLVYISMALLILKIIITIRDYDKFELLFGVIVAIVLYFCWKKSGTIDFIFNFIIMFALKNVDLKKVMKINLIFAIVLFIFGTTRIFIDHPTWIQITKDFGRGIVETRYKFSTWHPNILHLVISSLILIFLYIYYSSSKLWTFLVIFYMNFALYNLTKSRTGFLTGCIGIILFFVLRYAKKLFEFKITCVFFEIVNMSAILGTVYFGILSSVNSSLYMKINAMTTARPDVVRRFYAENGIHLFGCDLSGKLDGWGFFNQINPGSVPEFGFARLLMEYGPIIFSILTIIIFCVTIMLYRTEKYAAMILLTAANIGFAIDALYPAAWNPLPFAIGYGMFQHVTKNKKVAQDVGESE